MRISNGAATDVGGNHDWPYPDSTICLWIILILGTQEEEKTEDAGRTYQEETEAVYQLLNHVSKKERLYAAKVLRTFLIACSDMGEDGRTEQTIAGPSKGE